MLEYTNRTIICSILFMDIIEYSKKTVAKQLAMKGWLNDLLSEMLEHIPQTDRIMLDTGDGAVLCFLGDPEDALFAASTLRDSLIGRNFPEFALRIGINLGPVKIVKDMNGHPNAIGDGINVAQRVMSFAQPNQILVSRSYYEVVSRLADEYAKLFLYQGVHKDKHIREHEVYEVSFGLTGQARTTIAETETSERRDVPQGVWVQMHDSALSGRFDPGTLVQIETVLAKYIGPVAKLMVAKASKKASTFAELCEKLADSIPIEDGKSAFLKAFLELSPGSPTIGEPSLAEVFTPAESW